MNKNLAAVKRKEKIYIFLITYLIFMATRMTASFFDSLALVTVPTAAMLWLTVIIINLSLARHKISHSRAVNIFFLVICLWLGWGVFNALAGITSRSIGAIREFLALVVFTGTISIMKKIITIYDLKVQILRVTILTVGTMLIVAYIVRFDGFAFLGSIRNIMGSSGRYRYSYGLGHVNHTGRYCLYFFMLKSIYNAVVKEKKNSLKKYDSYGLYFSIISPVIAIMLLSTASRTSITGLIGFWIVYYFLTYWHKARVLEKILFIISIVPILAIIIYSVDWALVYKLSNRGVNYTILPVLDREDAWITGLGFLQGTYLFRAVNISVFDSFYLMVLFQSGIVGCIIFFGNLVYFATVYFSNAKSMTEEQKLVACLFVVALYYGIFERMFFGHGEFDIINWVLLLSCLDERTRNVDKQRKNILHNS